MSKHEAVVVPIKLEKHPNADSLSIVRIGGFQCVVNTEMWQGETHGVYILPDSIVPLNREEFSFLKKGNEDFHRVKCVRLRGEFSQGLLVKVPEGFHENDDLWDYFKLKWYEPELHMFNSGGDFAPAPTIWGGLPKYDVDNGRRNEVAKWFNENESVYVTEKLNGANCSFVFSDGKMHVRSRSGFRAEVDDMFHQALKNSPTVEEFCKSNPDTLVYGEAYGNVKGFRYDCKQGEIKFRVFDIMNADRTFYGYADLMTTILKHKMPYVPVVTLCRFNLQELIELAENPSSVRIHEHISVPSLLGNPICEGIVVKPIEERRYGNNRVMMKIISNKYLEKS